MSIESYKEGVFKLAPEEQEESQELLTKKGRGEILFPSEEKRIKELKKREQRMKGATTRKAAEGAIKELEKRAAERQK